MTVNMKKLGDYIQSVDVHNSDLKVSHLLGLSEESKKELLGVFRDLGYEIGL